MTHPPNIVFVDSSGWIALVNSRDSLHHQARRVYLEKLESGARLVTTTAVLLEVGNWLSPSNLRTLALDLLEKIEVSSLIEVTRALIRVSTTKAGTCIASDQTKIGASLTA